MAHLFTRRFCAPWAPAARVLGFALLLLPGLVRAQQAAEKASSPDAQRQGPAETPAFVEVPSPRAAPKGISIRFPGGTVGEFVDQVSKLGDINVIMAKEVVTAPMPMVELKNVQPSSALQLIPILARAGGALSIQLHPIRDQNTPIYVLTGITSRSEAAAATQASQSAEKVVEVFSLGGLVEGADPKQPEKRDERLKALVSAIDAAVGASDKGDKDAEAPTVQLHQESSLLIVRGTKKQLDLVKQVLERIGESTGKKVPFSGGSVPRDQLLQSLGFLAPGSGKEEAAAPDRQYQALLRFLLLANQESPDSRLADLLAENRKLREQLDNAVAAIQALAKTVEDLKSSIEVKATNAGK